MATCIHSSRSCLLPFYTIPIFPLLNRKIFHLLVIYTSAKIIPLNEYGCRDAPCENHGNKEIPLAILSRILAQSCVTLCLNYVGRVTHDYDSILDSIAKGISLFP